MNRRTLCRSIVVCVSCSRHRSTDPSQPVQDPSYRIQEAEMSMLRCICAYLRGYGFEVDVKITNELAQISSQAGIPKESQGCHTMFVDGYVVEGLVPGHVVRKLLSERPAILGITLPGMPAGSPGMAGVKRDFIIYAVAKDGAPPGIYTVE
jgi:hypothetical protein